MRFKAIYFCLLATMLAVPASVSAQVKPGADLQAAISNAGPNGEVDLGAGTFDVSQPLNIPSGITIKGAANFTSHLVFTVNGGDAGNYGMVLAANATTVNIQGIDIISNHGFLMGTNASASSPYQAITITNNQIKTGGGQFSDGTLVFGIYIPVPNDHLVITHNDFHDSTSARNWTTFFSTNAQYNYNYFLDINDGGQICYPGANVQFNNNYGTGIHRMGQEIPCVPQTTSLQVENNTFYDYNQPYYDTEGVSVVGLAQDVQITGNYFDASMEGGWGQADPSGVNRFGYAIECTGTQTCNVSGNTIVGQWAELVSSDIPDATVTGNSVYGSGLWGDFEGEPGAEGYGSVNASNNSIDRNSSDAPAPISLADAQAGTGYTIVSPGGGSGTTGGGGGTTGGGGGSTGGGGTGGGGGGITSGGGGNSQISGATVTINSDSSVTVTFDSPSTDIASAVVDVISTIGRQNFPPTVVPGLPSASLTKPTVTITGLHPGWYIDFTIVATGSGSNPATYTSNTITVFMPGSSTAPWQGLLWGGISVLQTDPYVQ